MTGAAMNGIAGVRSFVIASALLASSLAVVPPSLAEQKILRVIPQADLKVLDTHFNSIQVTKIYALMVYDTLYAWDSNFQPKPQMVESEAISPDKLIYTFTFRPWLKFHDAHPSTPKHTIPPLTRGMTR